MSNTNIIDSCSQKQAKGSWEKAATEKGLLGPQCTKEELDQEVNWIENTLTGILNQFARPIRITPFFKRWWTSEVQEARTEYARAKRRLKES
jgi:hypothetical protein